MSDILILAINARWSHTSFASRSLLANLGPLTERAEILEMTIRDLPVEILSRVLDARPRIVGLGVYIWNATLCLEFASMLKELRPEIALILGGPELVDSTDLPPCAEYADAIISGEAEDAFRELCESMLKGESPVSKFFAARPPDLTGITLPYNLYTDADIRNRKIYVEASRGCPMSCEFCLSSLDKTVRLFDTQRLLCELDTLWRRGARQFKFLDRSIHFADSRQLLEFFLDRWEDGAFLHFELIPDRIPDSLFPVLARFPAATIQLEIGIQSFDPEVGRRMSRRHRDDAIEKNIRRLRAETGVHIHADLIAGLPGDSLESLGHSFDRLFELAPHEIQFGILKRLRGTPLADPTRTEAVYNPNPPYDILQSDSIGFADMCRLRCFARYLDLVFNSGNFTVTSGLLLSDPAPFSVFLGFSDWLFNEAGATHSISLNRLARMLFNYLVKIRGESPDTCAQAINDDFARLGRKPLPLVIEGTAKSTSGTSIPGRQQRHLQGGKRDI